MMKEPCFLIHRQIAVVYIFPAAGEKWRNYAKRFAARYTAYLPDIEHKLIVVSNGGKPKPEMLAIFEKLRPTWFVHDNSGWDIGAYQHVAREVPCELMVCLGSSTYFRRKGWLDRMVESYDKHGMALYGAMGHCGDPRNRIWPHLRTTGFWFHPALLNAYPFRIVSTGQRYEFEHGRTSFVEWVRAQGFKRLMVAFDGEYEQYQWNQVKNGYHRGNQSNCLTGDRLTEPPFWKTQ